jgi:signal transduction histidine kinase/DNA-binding response OmpR family regulator
VLEVVAMSIRVKIAVVVVSVITLISAANLGVSFIFTQERLNSTIEEDLNLIANIADGLVGREINLLKAEVSSIAHTLSEERGADITAALKAQTAAYPFLISLTVFNEHGPAASYGKAPPAYANNRELAAAFGGEEILSSTYWDETSAQLMSYIYVPIDGDRVLAAGISGLHLSRLLDNFRIWKTGDFYILDAKGLIVASVHMELVKSLTNYIDLAKVKDDPNIKELGAVSSIMIKGGKGSAHYTFKGEERLSVYTPVTASKAGWILAAAAPVKESPATYVQRGLVISQLIFIILGILAAFLASDKLASHFRDVEKTNRSLAELNNKVKTASEAKSRFLANTSHEMRTPLNVIVGLSELMLKAGEVKGESGKSLEKIHDSGMTLLAIVNDLLDLSKVESGRFELIPAEYDVPSLINDTITANIIRIGEKPVELGLLIDRDIPSRLYGDELRIKQIINNLLSNAFKYTNEGKVTLCVMCEVEGENAWLTIRVTDEGIGIRREDIAKLFSDYNQVDAKSNRKIEGTGLGLAITKKLAEMMDGYISVESEYGKGSAFTVRIRQGSVTEEAIGREVAEDLKNFCYSVKKRDKNARLVRAFLPEAKVLVVDDMENNLYVAKGMLKPYGMQIDCVRSGQEAIARISGGKVAYNAIFMDHMMPELDGIETARLIREIGTDYAKSIPIIALTANAVIGAEKLFLDNGFQAFISKPIDIKLLDEIIRRWIGKGEETERTGQSAVPPGTKERLEDMGVDVDRCLTRFSDDWKTLTDVLRSFAVSTSEILFQFQEIKEEQLRDCAILLHGLKGSCRGICAEFLGELAEEMELAAERDDIEYIERNIHGFLTETAKFINALSNVLNDIESVNPKPQKDVPDAELLEKLSEYCGSFNMDGIDGVIAELDSYEYDSGRNLVTWIKERVERMEFSEIRDRLSFTVQLF